MDSRIPKIIDFLKLLDEHQINYHIGGSFLLMLHELTDDFYDVDILLDNKDYHKAFQIFRQYPYRIYPKTNPLFHTVNLVKVDFHQIHFDLLFDFKMQLDDFHYAYPLLHPNELISKFVGGYEIPCSLLEEWLLIYLVIGRDDKIEILDTYFKKHKKDSKPYFLEILGLPHLPEPIKHHIAKYL